MGLVVKFRGVIPRFYMHHQRPQPAPCAPPPAAPAPPTPAEERSHARSQLSSKGFDSARTNVAVAGRSGVGKSKFLNAIFKNNVAETGIVECTQAICKYAHPTLPSVDVWDMPGGGTVAHPTATYFYDKHIAAFDLVLVLTDTRIDEVAMAVIAGCRRCGVPFLLVRTKADLQQQALERDEALAPADARAQVFTRIREDVKAQCGDSAAYIVSAVRWLHGHACEWDEERLVDALAKHCAQ